MTFTRKLAMFAAMVAVAAAASAGALQGEARYSPCRGRLRRRPSTGE